MIDRRAFCTAIAAAAAARSLQAQPARPYRIAWVTTERNDVPSANLEAFRRGLVDLGYVEGRDVVIDAWSGNGSGERLQAMNADIVRSQPNVAVTAGGLALFEFMKAGSNLPIVFSVSADPVEAKIVESFARPGGNRTGISLFTLALVGKRMELIKEVLPRAKRVALIANIQHPGEQKELAAARESAGKVGLGVRYFPMESGPQLEVALGEIARNRDDVILAFADGFTMGFAERIAAFSRQARIPAVDGWKPFAQAGNLMIYGPVIDDTYRRLAQYVDKIRKGARPADLPVELPTKIELVVNLAVAKELGIAVPQSVLSRADEVIR